MGLSQKCQYAVRAVLELSKSYQKGAVPAAEVAANQAVPQRFLEVILNELKTTSLVDSRRGVQGGYYLTCDPKDLTVGRVIRLVEGPLDAVRCTSDTDNASCPLQGRCSLAGLWEQAKEAVESVYDSTTFGDLVKRDEALNRRNVPDYCI
jgi:Rrf2 family transcriptional regulator, cysteine metabolism repressor